MSGFNSALVIGASGGIGHAVRDHLKTTLGVRTLRTLSRRVDGFDVTDEETVSAQALRFEESGEVFDLIFDATGALEANSARPEKSFQELTPSAMADAFSTNAIGPALLFKHFTRLLPLKARGVFATLSARVGSIEDNQLGGWMSYRASKAALNQIVRCAAIETGRTRPEAVIVALHPGTIETALTKRYARGRFTATPAEAAAQMITVLNELTPDASGQFFDYAGEKIPW